MPREPVVLPVVVHIVYAADAENLSDAQIQSQIDILNRDFRGDTPGRHRIPHYFREKIGSAGWQFCLASQDPTGVATDGIIRVRTAVPAVAHPNTKERDMRVIKHSRLGGSDAWDTDRYINIWVGSTGSDAVIGDATFPGTAPDGEDGVTVDYRVFGGVGGALGEAPYHLGKTLTHEMGHYFDLYHLAGGGGCDKDDGVEDTPVQAREYFECRHSELQSCGSPDMIQNFMSLAEDPCLLFFTKGQIARMEQTLLTLRPGLMRSDLVCVRPDLPEGGLSGQFFTVESISTGQLIVQFKGIPETGTRLALYDLTGRLILEERTGGEQFYPMDTAGLPLGVYFLRVNHRDRAHTVKVLL